MDVRLLAAGRQGPGLSVYPGAMHAFTLLLAAVLRSVGGEEYCKTDTFHASCPPGHVIFMQRALYGRMGLGRCLERDYMVGCHSDVISLFDARCSGRVQCSMSVMDPDLVRQQQCPNDIVSHLSANYTCIQAFPIDNSTKRCKDFTLNVTTPRPSGYVSSAVISPPPRRPPCPLTLRALPGQTINLTLYDFGQGYPRPPPKMGRERCRRVARVWEISEGERGDEKELLACNTPQRGETAFVSKSHVIALQMNPELSSDHTQQSTPSNEPRYLFHYAARGCANPPLPKGASFQRGDGTMDITCATSGRAWHLVCSGTEWVGQAGNCTDVGPESEQNEAVSKPHRLSFPSGVLVAVMIGVALGVLMGFCLLFVVHTVRKRRRKEQREGWMKSTGEVLAGKECVDHSKYPQMDPCDPCDLHTPILLSQTGTLRAHIHPHPSQHEYMGAIPLCTLNRRLANQDRVYEKPTCGLEIQTLLSSEPANEGPPVCHVSAVCDARGTLAKINRQMARDEPKTYTVSDRGQLECI